VDADGGHGKHACDEVLLNTDTPCNSIKELLTDKVTDKVAQLALPSEPGTAHAHAAERRCLYMTTAEVAAARTEGTELLAQVKLADKATAGIRIQRQSARFVCTRWH
jgi:hypothetical protein